MKAEREAERLDLRFFASELDRLREASARPSWENLIVAGCLGSTNDFARALVKHYEAEGLELPPALVLALEQRAGRGRQGRVWSSPRGLGVYATLVFSIADTAALPSLPLLVGVGLCRALSPHLPRPCRLKWPNDLVVERDGVRRKLGGVLIESLLRSGEPAAVLAGFGVNHGQRLEELPAGATSVREENPAPPALARLAWDLVQGVDRELSHLGDGRYAAAAYRELSIHRPGEELRCRVGGAVVEGRFSGFDDSGRLRLDRGGEEVLVSAGEVIES